MDCQICDFNAKLGGSCRGLIKNPAAKVPFYVCPHSEDLDKLAAYLDKTTEKRAPIHSPSVVKYTIVSGALVCCFVQDWTGQAITCRQ